MVTASWRLDRQRRGTTRAYVDFGKQLLELTLSNGYCLQCAKPRHYPHRNGLSRVTASHLAEASGCISRAAAVAQSFSHPSPLVSWNFCSRSNVPTPLAPLRLVSVRP